MSNMELWDAVSKTNPKYTKQVNQRGGFTAVNANAQVMAATKQFGPVGKGWGYDAQPPIFPPDGFVIVPVTLWHGSRDNVFGPEYGCAEIVDSKGRRDTDAPKKATTDALTKLLSRLGFNADVFLGLYDDNKYVASLREEFAEKPATITEGQRTELIGLLEAAGITLGGVAKKASENTGRTIEPDLSNLPASEFEPLMKAANDKIEAKKKENA